MQMLPISLDLAKLRVMLVGGGPPLLRRLELLEEAGAEALEIYAPDPEPGLVAIADARLRRRLPEVPEIARVRLVFVAGVEKPIAEEIRRVAQAAGVLINVEDDRARSDFHSAAVIRRGDLVVAVSTNGKSPGLAALMRQMLERRIGPEWGTRLDRIAALRKTWRESGAGAAAIGRRTREWAARHGWLDPSREPPSRLP
jgi:precorrin-2 dehydrogenase/sirohydrochlorin ferrochelatase